MSNNQQRKTIAIDHEGNARIVGTEPNQVMLIYELALETLVWENGGSILISHDRWERARREAEAANEGKATTMRSVFSKDYLTLTITDDTDRPIKGKDQ